MCILHCLMSSLLVVEASVYALAAVSQSQTTATTASSLAEPAFALVTLKWVHRAATPAGIPIPESPRFSQLQSILS